MIAALVEGLLLVEQDAEATSQTDENRTLNDVLHGTN